MELQAVRAVIAAITLQVRSSLLFTVEWFLHLAGAKRRADSDTECFQWTGEDVQVIEQEE